MHKTERDGVMTCLSQADRDHFRHLFDLEAWEQAIAASVHALGTP